MLNYGNLNDVLVKCFEKNLYLYYRALVCLVFNTVRMWVLNLFYN